MSTVLYEASNSECLISMSTSVADLLKSINILKNVAMIVIKRDNSGEKNVVIKAVSRKQELAI